AGVHPSYRELERAVRSLKLGGSSSSVAPARAAALRMMAMVVAGYPATWGSSQSSADPSALHEGLEEEGMHSLMLQSVVLHHFQQRTKREGRADTSEEQADHLVSEEE
ncbi:MAG: hypothetical protein SGPRY_008603, partial [Prymnesium sp.]